VDIIEVAHILAATQGWSTQLVFEIVTFDRNGDDISMVLCHFPKNIADIYEFSLVIEVVLINPTHALGLYVSQIE
jgi:hypothetical protein